MDMDEEPTPSLRGPSTASRRTSTSGKTDKKSTKVTEACFTPRTRRFAILSKTAVRSRVALVDPFACHIEEREEFVCDVLSDLAKEKPRHKEVFARLQKNAEVQAQVATFVSALFSYPTCSLSTYMVADS